MDQAQLEIELGAWKNIAIDKQVLLSDVFNALGLNEQSSNEELKSTLKNIIDQANNAADNISKTKAELVDANVQIVELKKQVASIDTIKDQATATEAASKQAEEAAKKAEQAAEAKVRASKKENAEEVKKITQQLKEKQKEIKSIHKVLADSPENVVKKLKALNREKHDESTLRKQAEADSRTLRKQVKELEKEKTDLKDTIEKGSELVTSVKELQTVANDLYTELAEKVEDKDAITKVPDIDSALLELFETELEEA